MMILHIARSFYEKLYASNMPSLEDIESYFDTVQAENKLDDDAQQTPAATTCLITSSTPSA